MTSNAEQPAVVEVKALLKPQLMTLLEYLQTQDETTGLVYFTGLLVQLEAAEEEADLLAFCIELSKAAFVGIQYDDVSWHLTDTILADAERVSMTFLANENQVH